MFGSLFSVLGEMGMESRGTGELGLRDVGGVSSVAMRRGQDSRREGGRNPWN